MKNANKLVINAPQKVRLKVTKKTLMEDGRINRKEGHGTRRHITFKRTMQHR